MRMTKKQEAAMEAIELVSIEKEGGWFNLTDVINMMEEENTPAIRQRLWGYLNAGELPDGRCVEVISQRGNVGSMFRIHAEPPERRSLFPEGKNEEASTSPQKPKVDILKSRLSSLFSESTEDPKLEIGASMIELVITLQERVSILEAENYNIKMENLTLTERIQELQDRYNRLKGAPQILPAKTVSVESGSSLTAEEKFTSFLNN